MVTQYDKFYAETCFFNPLTGMNHTDMAVADTVQNAVEKLRKRGDYISVYLARYEDDEMGENTLCINSENGPLFVFLKCEIDALLNGTLYA